MTLAHQNPYQVLWNNAAAVYSMNKEVSHDNIPPPLMFPTTTAMVVGLLIDSLS